MIVSHVNSSLVYEEVEEQHNDNELSLLIQQPRDLELNWENFTVQPLYRVVKVKGNLTVSF